MGLDAKVGFRNLRRVGQLDLRKRVELEGANFKMNDATTSLLTEHFSYTPLVRPC